MATKINPVFKYQDFLKKMDDDYNKIIGKKEDKEINLTPEQAEALKEYIKGLNKLTEDDQAMLFALIDKHTIKKEQNAASVPQAAP